MDNQALYRKYRSADFDHVIGQGHVTKTLVSAISSGHVSHAYLFTGPRGVGKTSVARLLARALNCTGDTKPCNRCESCLAAINSSLDIVEIDAASNNGVDDVRELRDKVSIAPTSGAYKIYIIDEVHMLSTGAFNALLKTLEEPPRHAVFILATTEAHKVPATIMSRTQSFAFKPISESDITAHLKAIAKAENIILEDDAARLIARSARGGFRDAIGMLDQMSSEAVTAASVRNVLGYSDEAGVEVVSRALAASDGRGALMAIDELVAGGAQPAQIAIQLAEQWREVLRFGLRASESSTDIVGELAEMAPPARCAVIIDALMAVTKSPWLQMSLETAVVRLTALSEAPPPPPVPQLAPAPTKAVREPKRTTSEEPAQRPTGEASVLLEPARWPKVLVLLKQHHSSLCALLQMYPMDFSGDTVTVRARFNFHRDMFNKPQNRQAIEAAAAKVFGRPITVTAITDDSAPPKKGTHDTSDDLAAAALEILGGEVID